MKKTQSVVGVGAALLLVASFISIPHNAAAMSACPSTASVNAIANVAVGSHGQSVETLQAVLSCLGYEVSTSGTYDENTSPAVAALQSAAGISGNAGMNFGPRTRAAALAALMKQNGSSMSMSVPTTDTKAAGLRVLLNALERQHVDLAANAVRRGFDGAADFGAAAAELDKNSIAISDAIASVYGKAAGDQFLPIWRSHIGFFVDYTVAAKKGDKPGMDKAVKNLLEGYVPAIADFFSSANPNLPRAAVAQLVTDHVVLLKGAVDAYGANDFAGSYSKQSDAYSQIGTIADAIAGAIVKQYPEKF